MVDNSSFAFYCGYDIVSSQNVVRMGYHKDGKFIHIDSSSKAAILGDFPLPIVEYQCISKAEARTLALKILEMAI